MKISNLPPNVTEADILKQLSLDSKSARYLRIFSGASSTGTTSFSTAYIVKQSSEILLRRKIHQWHGQLFNGISTYTLSCQIEFMTLAFPSESLKGAYNLFII